MFKFYTNQIGVSASEMARLHFFEIENENAIQVATAIMPIEVMRNMVNVMQQTLQQYDEAMQKAKENRNTLS